MFGNKIELTKTPLTQTFESKHFEDDDDDKEEEEDDVDDDGEEEYCSFSNLSL
jgi:hypothetical protein